MNTQVQEHTNEKVPLAAADYAKFLWFMVNHGLSPQTVTAIVKQLAGDVLRHRVITTYEAEAESITSTDLVQRILDNVEVP